MSPRIPRLSREQWDFLALFEAFNQPLSIYLAGEMAPLAPGPFLELLRLTENNGWLVPTAPDKYRLASELPTPLRDRLSKINSPERLGRLIQILEQKHLQGSISANGLSSLVRRSGQVLRAAEIEYAQATESLQNGHLHEAARHLENTLDALSLPDLQPAAESLLISATIELSTLRHHLGKSLGETPRMLQRAREAAGRQGDRRSKALIDLRLGVLSFASDNLSEALDALASGLDEVNDLGDEDIVAQGAGFAGLYYFLQGMYKDAVRYYERAMVTQRMIANPTAFFFTGLTFGFCAANLGQFRRAIGVLNQYQRFFTQSGDHSLAALFESALGVVLLIMGRTKRAHELLATAMNNSKKHENNQALLIARIGLAHCLALEGRMETASDLMLESTRAAAESDHVIRQYIFPFILEDIYCFQSFMDHTQAFVSFETEMDRIINGPNIHLRGTAYRLRARSLIEASGDPASIRGALETSLKYLRRAGDPLEQAKTTALLALLELESGHDNRARELARAAWPHLTPFGDIYFPQQLKRLVDSARTRAPKPKTDTSLVDRFLEMLEEFVPSTELDEMLTRVVMASCKFFEAERGGLFWFSGRPTDEAPNLRTSFNLSPEEVCSPEFHQRLGLVTQAFSRNCPVFAEPGRAGQPAFGKPDCAVICLPVEVHGRVRGVLYHDNAYLQDTFDLVDAGILQRVTKHMSVYVERLWEYSRLLQRTSPDGTGRALAAISRSKHIIGQSPAMRTLLAQTDKVAASEASILLLGETGVGKELLARRIHEISPRAAGPFVVVDVTSISESLMESELFGHEKGAFTGADRQKPGRLELADGGTVFLDEVGEIPLSMQAKFLRVLQEKTFTRVGGTKSLSSDFRLVAATNRDLEAEVAAGRFREDLYYRLNVIPLKIVPLRQRSGDILELSRVFLEHYERKHNRPHLDFSREDEGRLTSYNWPGNVRELKNVIERAVLVSTPDRLELFLPSVSGQVLHGDNFADLPTMDELQARYIRYVLEKTGGRIAGPEGAASLLGLKRGTLYSRIKKLKGQGGRSLIQGS
jgi:transcriptional regulator with GAF, ATPase, and Fis domain